MNQQKKNIGQDITRKLKEKVRVILQFNICFLLPFLALGKELTEKDGFKIIKSSLNGHLFFLKDYPGEIYSLELSKGKIKPILPKKFAKEVGNFDVSRDGKRIVFASKINGNWDIWMGTLNRKKTKVSKIVPLISTTSREDDPKFSPDGSSIVYKSNDDIYIYNFNKKTTYPLTTTAHIEEWAPCFSPDGKSVAFTRGTDRTFPPGVIVLANLVDHSSKVLTSPQYHDWYPTFNSQGNLIFVSQRNKECDDDLYFLDKSHFNSINPDAYAVKLDHLSSCMNISEADPSISYANPDILFYVSNQNRRYGIHNYSFINKRTQPLIYHNTDNLLAPIHVK